MSQIYREFDIIKNKLKIKKFSNELKNISDDHPIRAQHIQTILDELETFDDEAVDTENKMEIKHVYDEITKLMFQKPWNKLPEIHKILKVKEFVNQLIQLNDKKSQKKKKKLLEKLVNGIRKRELTKKNTVEYDSKNACIIKINKLEYNEEKKVYNYK